MIKETIIVPAGIRYVSDWEKLEDGYSIVNYQYPHIINKQLTGCGFTEYCITNQFNVVICSPRKLLLENKESQHGGEVLYVNNELENSEITFDKDIRQRGKLEEQKYEEVANPTEAISRMENRIKDYVREAANLRKPYKILVTYDSFRHVKRVLSELNILQDFFIVIDEFQSIFVDSRFKSTTEIEFVSQLQGINKVCYVSATPMLDKYLDRLEEFKDLPYYEFDWKTEDPNRAVRPRLEVKATKSILLEASRIIEDYRNGIYSKYSFINSDGDIEEIESDEAVLYFNSVKSICQLIKKHKLTQEECNVLCARTWENEDKVRKAFGVKKKEFNGLGVIPKKGEPHKMFTFCTRTVYLGADFYSKKAKSFIFSDSNIECLSVDISLDLPQILGRQRLDENPWRNSAELYYRPLSSKPLTQKEFDDIINKKADQTKKLLGLLDGVTDKATKEALIGKFERDIPTNSYKSDYIAINQHCGSSPVPVFNNLVMVSEQRAFDIQQVDYRDRFTVFNTLTGPGKDYSINMENLTKYLTVFDSLPTFKEKMKFLISHEISDNKELFDQIVCCIPVIFVKYINVLGIETIRSLSCQKSKLEEEYQERIKVQRSEDKLANDIYAKFVVGNRYTASEAKDGLNEIYKMHEMNRKAKATDLNEYFTTRRCSITNKETGKEDRGVVIVSKID